MKWPILIFISVLIAVAEAIALAERSYHRQTAQEEHGVTWMSATDRTDYWSPGIAPSGPLSIDDGGIGGTGPVRLWPRLTGKQKKALTAAFKQPRILIYCNDYACRGLQSDLAHVFRDAGWIVQTGASIDEAPPGITFKANLLAEPLRWELERVTGFKVGYVEDKVGDAMTLEL